MGWFQIATARSGRDYSVSTFPTGLSPSRLPTSAVARIPRGTLDYVHPTNLIRLLIIRVVYRGGWTVVVAPWGAGFTRDWKVRLATEAEADHRAWALHQLIHTGQWDPKDEPPPQPALVS